jgi:hypothetical protein
MEGRTEGRKEERTKGMKRGWKEGRELGKGTWEGKDHFEEGVKKGIKTTVAEGRGEVEEKGRKREGGEKGRRGGGGGGKLAAKLGFPLPSSPSRRQTSSRLVSLMNRPMSAYLLFSQSVGKFQSVSRYIPVLGSRSKGIFPNKIFSQ